MFFTQADFSSLEALLLAVQGSGLLVTGRLWFKSLNAYYFGADEKCNFFVARRIAVDFSGLRQSMPIVGRASGSWSGQRDHLLAERLMAGAPESAQ
jgi:hypothetical protein